MAIVYIPVYIIISRNTKKEIKTIYIHLLVNNLYFLVCKNIDTETSRVLFLFSSQFLVFAQIQEPNKQQTATTDRETKSLDDVFTFLTSDQDYNHCDAASGWCCCPCGLGTSSGATA